MSTEPFIGEIKILGFNFAPVSYMLCSGQLLPIAQYTALFSLIGTNYGGDGQVSFALPDLQGRMPIGQGQVPGLPAYTIGGKSGTNSVSILTPNIPAHIHTLNSMSVKLKASTANADENGASENFPCNASAPVYSSAGATANTFTGGAVVSGTTDSTGSGLPLDITNPYLVINYSIAVEGIFPSRN